MVSRLLAFILILPLLLAAVPAAAAPERALDLLDAKVSYTAQFYVISERGRYDGQLWHVPGRERRDFGTAQGGQVVIIRRDTDSAYLMKPGGGWYVGLALSAVGSLAGGVDSLLVERRRLDEQSVNGQRATRYHVSATSPRGGAFEGEAWFTAQGIMVKAKGVVTAPNGQSMPVETGLTRIKIGAVDESVFQLPSGWLAIDLRSVPAERIEQAVESLRPLLEGRR